MEPEGSLPPLQVPAIYTYPETDQFSLCPPPLPPTTHLMYIHLNIVIPSMPGSLRWSLSLRFSHQNSVYTSSVPHTCYIPHPSHSSQFDHLNSIGWGVWIIKLLIMKFTSLTSPHPPYTQIFSWTPYSQTPSSYLPPSVWATKVHTHTKQQTIL
jgi:hypothetical protein